MPLYLTSERWVALPDDLAALIADLQARVEALEKAQAVAAPTQ